MDKLMIDLETFSDVDIKKAGAYRYVGSPAFEILLFGASVDDGPVDQFDLASGESIPDAILDALTNPSVKKHSYNAAFERICLSEYLKRIGFLNGGYLDPDSWYCDMVLAAYNGLPISLEGCGAALGLPEQKLKEGRELIRYFCVPCKATKANGGRTRNLPEHAPEKWELFKKYNRRDVEVEMQIHRRLANYPVPAPVWDEYHQDQEINDRGIMIDRQLVEQAIRMDTVSKEDISQMMKELTGLENPNSVPQLQGWLKENGFPMETLGKKEVASAMKDAPREIAEVLSLRLMLAKSSVKKYRAMENSVCDDGRCHGMFQFYGANRTGRWAGRLIQLQNLPQNHMPDLAEARELVKTGDYEMLKLLYGNVPQVLSELVRTAFIPRPGNKFIVADFSAIEARVLSYLAGETWRSEVFRTGGDIYCMSASQMFGVPVEKHGVNGHLRQKGKIAELACGYSGSVGALRAMGALEMGLGEDELQPLVDRWRKANPHIVEYWRKVDRAVKTAVREHAPSRVGDVEFFWKSGMLFIKLPSGRLLAYVKPQIGVNRFGGESVTYMGTDSTKKWSRVESYSGKFVENLTQAISRDILCYAMKSLRDCRIVGHVHDEVIIECPMDASVKGICEIMGQTPPWMPGLLLNADGYECSFYMKS